MKTKLTMILAAAAFIATPIVTSETATAQRVTGGFIGISDGGFQFGIGFHDKKKGKYRRHDDRDRYDRRRHRRERRLRRHHRRDRGVGIHIGIGVGRRHVHGPACTVVTPGHYEIVRRRVWRPGFYKVVAVPARYVTRYDECGRPYQYLIEPAGTREIWVEGHYDVVEERVWVAATTTYTCGY